MIEISQTMDLTPLQTMNGFRFHVPLCHTNNEFLCQPVIKDSVLRTFILIPQGNIGFCGHTFASFILSTWGAICFHNGLTWVYGIKYAICVLQLQQPRGFGARPIGTLWLFAIIFAIPFIFKILDSHSSLFDFCWQPALFIFVFD